METDDCVAENSVLFDVVRNGPINKIWQWCKARRHQLEMKVPTGINLPTGLYNYCLNFQRAPIYILFNGRITTNNLQRHHQ
jgi:hypothetical protein